MLWAITKEVAVNWSNHRDSRQGAALAYYSMFSLGPIIFVATSVAGLFFGQDDTNNQVSSWMTNAFGATGAVAIQAMLTDARRPRDGTFSTALSLGALLVVAMGVVVQLKDALNTVWEVTDVPGKSFWPLIRTYLTSLAAVFASGFFLVASLAVTTLLAAFGAYVTPHIQEWILHAINFLVSTIVVSLLFAMIYKYLPDTEISWNDLWFSAFFTAILFEIGKIAISFYIAKQGFDTNYGAAASIMVVLIWVYYSSQILLLGAELSYAIAKHHGSIKLRQQTHLKKPAVSFAK